ncbi:DUF1524 domain-containing protein, partial [Gammaproteobacteria bacterium]|nr:DUF1524 domain-containing protein [Gammaproteobacteria bacterium]
PQKDIIDVKQDVSFPSSPGTEVHHIFPKKWIDNNFTQPNFGHWFTSTNDKDQIGKIKKSIVNLTPLVDQSNKTWSSSSPGTIIPGLKNSKQKSGQPIWKDRFINGNTFAALQGDMPTTFLQNRAEEVADWLLAQTTI